MVFGGVLVVVVLVAMAVEGPGWLQRWATTARLPGLVTTRVGAADAFEAAVEGVEARLREEVCGLELLLWSTTMWRLRVGASPERTCRLVYMTRLGMHTTSSKAGQRGREKKIKNK